MQYLVKRGCVINQRPTQPGDIVELDPATANELVRSRSIEPLPADAPPAKDRSVGLDEAKPRRRGRPRKNPPVEASAG